MEIKASNGYVEIPVSTINRIKTSKSLTEKQNTRDNYIQISATSKAKKSLRNVIRTALKQPAPKENIRIENNVIKVAAKSFEFRYPNRIRSLMALRAQNKRGIFTNKDMKKIDTALKLWGQVPEYRTKTDYQG